MVKYDSYADESTSPVLNKIERAFSVSDMVLNSYWILLSLLFLQKKVYLSKILDCFDYSLVAWRI